MGTMPARASYPKGVAKREEILRTALDVFASQGYLKTSIRELAEAANLSQAGLLHYFGSKEELLVAILKRRDEVNHGDNDVPVGQFDTFLAAIRGNVEVPGLVQLFATMSAAGSDASHPAHEFFVERYAAIRSGMAADFARRQAAGELDTSLDPTMLATIMLSIADGIQVQWLLDPEVDMPAHLEYVWKLIHDTNPG